MIYFLKGVIFHGYVSVPEGIHGEWWAIRLICSWYAIVSVVSLIVHIILSRLVVSRDV